METFQNNPEEKQLRVHRCKQTQIYTPAHYTFHWWQWAYCTPDLWVIDRWYCFHKGSKGGGDVLKWIAVYELGLIREDEPLRGEDFLKTISHTAEEYGYWDKFPASNYFFLVFKSDTLGYIKQSYLFCVIWSIVTFRNL